MTEMMPARTEPPTPSGVMAHPEIENIVRALRKRPDVASPDHAVRRGPCRTTFRSTSISRIACVPMDETTRSMYPHDKPYPSCLIQWRHWPAD